MAKTADSRSRVASAERSIQQIGFCYYDKEKLSWRPLSSDDHELLHIWLVLQLHLLDDLVPSQPYALRRFSQFLSQGWIDVVELGETIKSASKLLRQYPKLFEQGERWSKTSFKQTLGCLPATWCFFTPVLEILVQYFNAPCPSNLRTLLQWVDFGLKIKAESIRLRFAEETEYLVFNDEQRFWTYDEGLLTELSDVIGEWIDDSSILSELIPEHGNGATAELPKGSGAGAKYWLLWSDPMLRWWLGGMGYRESDFYPTQPFWYDAPLGRCAVLQAVPKTLTGNRLISKEPATLIYFQGAVSRQIDREVFRKINQHVDLHNADKSALMAYKGSVDGRYDTLDLSSASDSVTLTLVWGALAKCKRLRKALIATRSRWVETSYGVIRSRFFAPMGSKLCFPIETLIFAAICGVAAARVGRRCHRKLRWRVYGDDIVCDRRMTSEVLAILEALHFEVNTKKSHYATTKYNFREACGGEFFNSQEVTPVRLSRMFHFTRSLVSPEDVETLIGLNNNLFNAGLLSTRRALMRIVNDLDDASVWKKIPFSTDGSIGLVTHDWSCTNYRLGMRKFLPRKAADGGLLDFQNTEVYRFATGVERQPFADDEVRLFEWFRRSATDEGKTEWNVRFAPEPIELGSTMATLKYRWSPLSPVMGYQRDRGVL